MGTNFYRKPVLTKERKQRLHDLIEQEKLFSNWDEKDNPESSVSSMISWLDSGVHICKRSGGWFIGFDHNWGKYYQPNRKSLEEFLSEPGYEIVDEYGRIYSPEEFWEMVDNWNNSPNLTSFENYSNEYLCTEDIRKVHEIFGINTSTNDFIVDGLRFSVFSDFS